jgi:tetratricopeptide (TPR) repeat protein
MKPWAALALAAVALVAGCKRESGSGRPQGPHAEARALIEQGKYDAALARLGGGEGDPDALYLLGRAWAGKARLAGIPFGPELRPEERQALDFFERAVAARPGLAAAHHAIGDLLAPHALAGLAAPRSRGARGASPAAVPEVSVDRVLEAYGEAVQADLGDTSAVNALIAFALKAGRTREAEQGFEELVRRDRENPDVLVRFGDFLAGPGGKPKEALSRYAQALIWRPDDIATRSKMADIHLDAARRHLDEREYPAAESELREAQKLVSDPAPPEAARIREMKAAIAEVRGRP